MRNDEQKSAVEGGNVGLGRRQNGVFPVSFRALSKIVSSGASTVASTVRSAASAIVEKDNDSGHDQVLFSCYYAFMLVCRCWIIRVCNFFVEKD